ncbi:hypothetical protein QCA50_002417 [Cerrena zonata]|uniref:S15/NS1 RNA-binding domain-containing protein n=1 Tax=Cerrena zonata TaxID=2478898 RepID=A0AAW0GRG4_9APHY
MLSLRFTQCSRLVASTSTSSAVPAACLHTSAVRQAGSARRHKQVQAEKKIEAMRAEKLRQEQLNRPHVVLGNRPGDEAKWANCDLAKAIITEEQILAAPTPSLDPSGKIQLPETLNFGVGEAEKELLFETLPVLGTEMKTRKTPAFKLQEIAEGAEADELRKVNTLAIIADLRNANAGGIAYANRRRIIEEFSEPGKPNDTGRPEVQAALATYTIRKLWAHLQNMKKDVANRRNLRKIVHHRAKILKYLKRTDRDRYEDVLQRLGLEPEAVEGELVV